jgi:hypothetical protein
MHHVDARDKFFVCGGNPRGNGGGVIASFNNYKDALALSIEAIKVGYVRVKIYTWNEMFQDYGQKLKG